MLDGRPVAVTSGNCGTLQVLPIPESRPSATARTLTEYTLSDAWIAARQRNVKKESEEALTDNGPIGFLPTRAGCRPDIVQEVNYSATNGP
ncbi:hypothetical protein GCM10009665_10890 [Kitasatospora nipponensis]|uniref:Uncharacterized protein n=1 Tax=Kitasatospora nipponensis TaxID=258049 RepID=A0ABP4GEA2_9ACTN